MPQPNLRGPDGRRHRLDDIAGRGFVLIGAGVDPRASLDIEALALWQRRNQSRSEMMLPDTINRHSRREGMIRFGEPPHQRQPSHPSVRMVKVLQSPSIPS